ncbi:MAG: periplasmic protein TonB [Sphingomonadales bacterium]|jgi:protein TonB|nr:periplasmic protein TonB [Sphingomonadales bacterium]
MALAERWTKERVRAAAGALLLEALLGYGLIVGLGVRPPAPVRDQLKMFGILPDPPPPPPEPKAVPPPKPVPEPEGAASPPNLKAVPTEIVRPPPPPVRLPPPPPIAAAPVAGPGTAPSAGAALVAGPGTGAGGQGNGLGAGRGGAGGGSGAGVATPARFIKGELRDKDYPRDLGELGIGGTVVTRFVVGTDGRVSGCTVTRSSGNAELDSQTCRLIEQRYRYKPARDSSGRPVASIDTDDHEWVSRPPVPVDDADDRR